MNRVTVALTSTSRAVRRLIWDEGTRQVRGRRATAAHIIGVVTRLFCVYVAVARSVWLLVSLSRGEYAKALGNSAFVVVFAGLLFLDFWQRFRKAATWPPERGRSLPSRNIPRDSG